MPCPLGANTRRARASFRGVYLQGQAGCLSCLLAVRLLHFQVVLLGRGENERVAVVDLWCKASAVLVLPALMSHLTASEAGDRGAEVEKSTLEGPAKHDGRWRKR
jgi:hypothetical protein